MGNRAVPAPIIIYRLVHTNTLPTLIERGGLHAPNFTPTDGLPYHTIHNLQVQASRRLTTIPCGPGGTIHDYVPFYFGPLSPMLLNLKTGRVAGYNEGQEPLIYLVTTVQKVEDKGGRYVFSDGHGLARFTNWYDKLSEMDQVDWAMVEQRYWSDQANDNDRMRRKQAEFLVYRKLDWTAILAVGVYNSTAKQRVHDVLDTHPGAHCPRVLVKDSWYY
jgi:hypothetical protein